MSNNLKLIRVLKQYFLYRQHGWSGSLYLVSISIGCLLGVLWFSCVQGVIKGVCSDCHTMHNSQDNAPMTFDNSTTPNDQLLRGTCYGCHAQGGATPTVMVGTSVIPQVMHSGPNHLAGGNFGYITGMAGSGASDKKGHNIVDLTGEDSDFNGDSPPPGVIAFHDTNFPRPRIASGSLSCEGVPGCHGYRAGGGASDDFPKGMTGSHHTNVDGKLDNPTNAGDSYRFLFGVKGFESSDWQENPSSANHNEYFARAAPIQLTCGPNSCHQYTGVVKPEHGTISQFCGSCHGNFHTLAVDDSDGIGATATSPFIRHPTDLSLPATGEYASYTSYNLSAPVGRLSVPDSPSGIVTPGSDAVICLSCHVAHASDYPSMLRWDYDTMIAGNGGAASDTGCFVCHTTKD